MASAEEQCLIPHSPVSDYVSTATSIMESNMPISMEEHEVSEEATQKQGNV